MATSHRQRLFNETNWTNIQADTAAYVKSKALLKRAALGFHRQ